MNGDAMMGCLGELFLDQVNDDTTQYLIGIPSQTQLPTSADSNNEKLGSFKQRTCRFPFSE